MRQKWQILSAAFLIAVLLLGLYALNVFRTVQVNGPIYQNIIQGKDVIADVLPPPLYIIETYLVCLQALIETDTPDIATLRSRLNHLQISFRQREEVWKRDLTDERLREALLSEACDPAEEFYRLIFEQFLPALERQDHQTAQSLVSGPMRGAYDTHREAILRVVELASIRNVQEEENARNRIRDSSTWLTGLFFMVFLFTFLLSIRWIGSMTTLNRQLEDEVNERKTNEQKLSATREQIRLLVKDLEHATDNERQKIAAELHDHVCQILALIRLKLGMEINDQMQIEIRQLVDQAIQGTRSLLSELSPPVLRELDLTSAMEWLAEQVEKQYSLTVHCQISLLDVVVSEEIRTLIFRAARELLINAAKHAEVRTINLEIRIVNNDLHLTVSDAGIGFDPQRVDSFAGRSISGFGLFSLRERLWRIRGQLMIDSAPGNGTRMTVILPLQSVPATVSVVERNGYENPHIAG